jgi:hypothetical protein
MTGKSTVMGEPSIKLRIPASKLAPTRVSQQEGVRALDPGQFRIGTLL